MNDIDEHDKVNAPASPPTGIPRRSFLRRAGLGAALLAPGAGLIETAAKSFAQSSNEAITQGDAAMLRFAAAAEILETDFWQQYNELGGIPDNEVRGGTGNPIYTKALKVLDGDMDQYIHDNTEDEFTHFTFLNAYLASKGADPVNLDKFRTLRGSMATGSRRKLRLTNLMQLTLDTSCNTRYRSRTHNPDLNPNFVFPQAIPDLSKGQFTAIPRTDDDLHPPKHILAIATNRGISTSRRSNRVETASTLRWRSGLPAWKCCGFLSASVRQRPCISRHGRTRRANIRPD